MVIMSLAPCLKNSESLTSENGTVVGKKVTLSPFLAILALGK